MIMRALLALPLLLTACSLGGGGGTGAPDVSVAVTPPAAGANQATLAASVGGAQVAPVTYAWSWNGSGPAAPVVVSPLSATTGVLLPCAGTYGLQVTVVDAAGRASNCPATVTVGAAGSVAVVMRVEDDGTAGVGAQVVLDWLPGGGAIRTATCDATGSATFAGLLGPVDDFRVRVGGGP